MHTSAFSIFRASLPLQSKDVLDRLVRKLLSLHAPVVVAQWPDRIQRAMPTMTRMECRALAEFAAATVAETSMKTAGVLQKSISLQYLQLQSSMQNDNRSYTAVSNIMKTKHDTVANSIENIR